MMTDIQKTSDIYVNRGKEISPEETVQRILACLDRAGLKTVYQEFPCDVEGCYSSRVQLDSPAGINFGTNGKGSTPAFAKASAYGELMERLQNIMFAVNYNLSERETAQFLQQVSATVDIASDELTGPGKMIVEKIAAGLPHFMPKFQKDAVMRELLSAFCVGNKTEMPLLEFYSLREDRVVGIPEFLLSRFIMSNGLAAGNSLEEATVQAVSEIFERKAAEHFLSGGGTPPEIPSACVERYPEIVRIIAGIEASGRYAVKLYDCSMGEGLPVVAGAIFDKEKMKVGIKFGAHPYMRIALERVFTEAMQGLPLENFCERGWISFPAAEDDIWVNTWNHLKISYGFVHDCIFAPEPDYAFREWPDTETLSGRELARKMLLQLDSLCDGVYIRDASFMGFPAVNVYAANYSEVVPLTLTEAKKFRLSRTVMDIFARGIENASDADVEKIERLIRIKSDSMMENTFSAITGQYLTAPLPGSPGGERPFLRAMCLYRLGRIQEAAAILSRMAAAKLPDGENARFLPAAALYVNGIAAGRSEEQVAHILRLSAPAQTAEKVIGIFADRSRVLAALYPSCHSDCENCRVQCIYPEIKRIFGLLYSMRQQHPIDQQHLAELFQMTDEK